MSESIDDFLVAALQQYDDLAALSAGSVDALRGHEIGALLGRGGMGSVYSARQHALERDVALKLIFDNGGDPERVARFRREALVLGRLEHPNIVPIHDLGKDAGGQHFYTMKLVKGRTLQTLLIDIRAGDKETVLQYPLAALLTVFRKVCDAMAFAHSQGVIHRDLKPDNIMIGEFGEVLVMDWGVAKLMDEDDPELDAHHSAVSGLQDSVSATIPGAVMGTPQYMSPEQARGHVDELDERSDVFSLGGILYAILTLRPPVEGTVVEVMEKVRSGSITSPAYFSSTPGRTGNGDATDVKLPHIPGARIPPALSAVAMKALSLDKAKRYPGVTALIAEIEAYQGGFATSAEKAGALKLISLAVKRHRAVTTALSVLLLASIGFVLKVMASERRAVAGEASANSATAAAEREKEAARRALARSQVSLSEAAFREHDSHAMLVALDGVPADLRESDWHYLHGRADTSRAKFSLPGGSWFSGAAPHPKKPGVFALASMDRTIVVVNALTGVRLSSFPVSPSQQRTQYFLGMEFSPDGERIIVGGFVDGGVAIYHAESGKVLANWDAKDAHIVHFSPDGTRALDVQSGVVTVRDAATGRELWNYRPGPRAIYTSTGNVLTANALTLRLHDGETGAVIKELPSARARVSDMVLAPDDATLFIASQDGYIRGLRLAGGETLFEQRLTENPYNIFVVLGGAGRRVVAASQQTDSVRIVRVWDAATGQLEQTLLGGSSGLEDLAAHSVSEDVLVTGPVTSVWSLATRQPQWKMPGRRTAAVFWDADDVFIPGGNPLRLDSKGRWSPLAGTLPADVDVADANGEFVAVGNSPPGESSASVLRKSADGFTNVRTFRVKGTLAGLRFSPSGARVAAFSLYYHVIAADTVTGGHPIACDEISGPVLVLGLGWIGEDRLVGLTTVNRSHALDSTALVLWDANTGRQLATAPTPAFARAIAVAPDGRSLAEGGDDKRIRIRDPVTLAVVRDFRAHDGNVTSLAYHPTKPILASASGDLTIRLWSMESGELIEEIRLLAEPQSLTFSPTGHRLASTDVKGMVSVWNLSEQ